MATQTNNPFHRAVHYGKKKLPLNQNIILVNALLFTIARVVSFHRVKIDFLGAKDIPICYNALLLGGSNIGKTSSLDLYASFVLGFEHLWNKERDEFAENNEDALKKFNINKTRLKPEFITQQGTPQGFLWNRFLLEFYGMGSSSLVQDEFLDHFLSGREMTLEAYVKEAYDRGNNSAILNKSISSGKITGVPSNTFLLSTADKLVNNEKGLEEFKNLLVDGYARRFVCGYVEGNKLARRSFEEWKAIDEAGEELRGDIQESFTNLQKSCVKHKGLTLGMSDEVEEYAFNLSEDFRIKGDSMEGDPGHERFFSAMYQGRMWKLIRVAALVALFDDPEAWKIEKVHIDVAIRIDDMMVDSFRRMFSLLDGMEETVVQKMLRKLQEEGILTKSALGDAIPRKYVGYQRQSFFSEFEDFCLDTGINLVVKEESTKGRGKKVYSIPPKEIPAPVLKDCLTACEVPPIHVTLLQTAAKVEESTKPESVEEFSPEEMCEYLQGDPKTRPYVLGHCTYRSGKTHSKIITGIPFDIDNTPDIKFFKENLSPVEWKEIEAIVPAGENGQKVAPSIKHVYEWSPERFYAIDKKFPALTREECEKILDGIAYVIQPSKSDGKEKSIKLTDGKWPGRSKYHGIVMLDGPVDLTDPENPDSGKRYQSFILGAYETLGIGEYTDNALATLSQQLYRSPHKAEYHPGLCLSASEIKPVTDQRNLFKAPGRIEMVPGLESVFRRYGHVQRGHSERMTCPLHAQSTDSPSFKIFRDDKGYLNAFCHSGSCPYAGKRLQVSREVDNELKK